MGEKFSWDRLLKRTKETEADNTIEMVQDQPAGPVAPLRAVQTPPVNKVESVNNIPPPVQNSQQSINRAPLIIDWDEFQQSEETASALEPINVKSQEMTQPSASTNTQQAAEPSSDNFWARLNQDTQAALNSPTPPQVATPPVTVGWEDVELTPLETNSTPAPIPVTPSSESSIMAGTMDPDSYQPITSTYQRPSEEEIKQRTEEIAQSSAWDETPAPPSNVQPVVETPTSQTIEPPFTQQVQEQPTQTVVEPEVFSPTINESPVTQNSSSALDAFASQTPPQYEPELPPVVEVAPPAPPVFDSVIESPVPVEEPPVVQEFSAPPVFDVLNENPSANQISDSLPEEPQIDSPNEVSVPNAHTSFSSNFDGVTINEPTPTEVVAESAQSFQPESQLVPEFVQEPVQETIHEPIESTSAFVDEPTVDPVPVQATPEDFWANIPGASSSAPAQPEPPKAEVVAIQQIPTEYTQIEESEAPQQVEKDIRIGDVLLKHKLVAPAQLERALARQADSNEKLGQVLISMGLISERRLLQVLASQKGVSPWHLEDDAPSQSALELVSHEQCQLFQVLPVAVRGDLLLLAMRDTQDHEAIEMIRASSGKRIEPVLADEVRLAFTIDQAYGVIRERPHSAVEEMVEIALEQEVNLSDGTVVNPERPDHLTALLRELITDARRKDATSITIAEKDGTGEIMYRIHGRLCPVQHVPHSLAQSVIEHAQSDLEQERLPFAIENGFKVAITSGQNGNQFVVTFPVAEKALVPLDELGIESENLKLLREINERPYGLFLITGSARSSKDATLASLAEELQTQGRVVARASEGENIAEQIVLAVTSESEVIVVGELDREEDIQAAVKAASSGHLILAEVTANDAPTAIQQLISCGADPYLLATILTGVWCQAVAPKLCLNCRHGQDLTDVQREILDQYGMRHIQKVFESCGCESCNHTSVTGQIVLSEILPVSSDVSHMIAEKAPVEKISEQAGFAGYLPMDYDAMTRVIHGDVDFATAKKLVFFKHRQLAAISRRDSWETQAS